MDRYRKTVLLSLTLVLLVIAGCETITVPPQGKDVGKTAPTRPAVSGAVHNEVLARYLEKASTKDAFGLDRKALRLAGESLLSIPDTLPFDQWLDRIEKTYCADCAGGIDPSFVPDARQRRWLETLLPRLLGAGNSDQVISVLREHGARYGLPAAEPLLSFVDVILGSAEYHRRDGKKWSSVVIVADGVGALRGAMVPGPPGVVIGIFFSVAYSVMANEALPPDS